MGDIVVYVPKIAGRIPQSWGILDTMSFPARLEIPVKITVNFAMHLN
ncbi:hypothetical protein [Clostridium sp. KNHs205]|nr:hypothetical protein [Clostridium sp. KNHs205]